MRRRRAVTRERRRRRSIGSLVVALMVAASLAACAPGSGEDDQSASDVGVQLFQWTWNAIGRECGEFLGPAGYSWVLTSPPQEHILGEQWWTAYQPVSYRIESRLGTREEFAAMVAACDEAGVAVIADAVINHMTGQGEPGVGWAGSPYAHYEYPGLYSDAEGDFHHCGLTPGDDIDSYREREQVQTCELLNLADLATGTERVRDAIAGYLLDLLSLGVAGFRIDAAKHMAAEDVAAIVDRLPEGTRIMQEVIGASGEPIQPAEYLGSGDVLDFEFSRELGGFVGGGSVHRVLEVGTGASALPREAAVVFVENHDTERNRSTLRHDDERYAQAVAIMLAGDFGAPIVHSGYAFSNFDAGPAQDADGAVLDAECPAEAGPHVGAQDGDWLCQHRWPEIAGMVDWRRAAGGEPIANVQSPARLIGFDRGEVAFFATNGSSSPVEQVFDTALPDGDYCDVIAGPAIEAPGPEESTPDGSVPDGVCAGDVVVVADGRLTVGLEPGQSLALHTGARTGD